MIRSFVKVRSQWTQVSVSSLQETQARILHGTHGVKRRRGNKRIPIKRMKLKKLFTIGSPKNIRILLF